MQNTITILSSSEFYAHGSELISSYSLGTEYLGWEPGTQRLDSQINQYGFTHLRTPGGLPVEDPWTSDTGTGRIQNPTLQELQFGDYAYSLSDPNYVDWYRWDGSEREGIQELAGYALQNNIASLSIVVPTARYAAQMFDPADDGSLNYADSDDGITNSVAEAVELARSDMTTFLTNYYFEPDGTARDVPEKLTIELGSEYYETNLWTHFMVDNDANVNRDLALESLQTSLGLTFAAVAEAIGDFEDVHGVEINTVVQLGRVQSHSPNLGSIDDNNAFIEQFQNDQYISSDAIAAVDGGIWHRYITYWDGFDNFLDAQDPDSVQGMLDAWLNSGASDTNLVGGWMAPAVQAEISESKYHVSLMLQMYSELMAAGMDIGTVFAGNANNVGALSFKDDLMMGGQLYAMMNEHLPDTYILAGFDANVSFFDYREGEPIPKPLADQVNVHNFANDKKVVSYLTVGDISANGLTAQLELDDSFSEIQITRLFASETPVWVENTQGIQLGYGGLTESYTIYDASALSNLEIDFSHDFELVQIVATRALTDEAVVLASLDSASSNPIVGFDVFSDQEIYGGKGDQVISGGGGNDILFTGLGNNELFGKAGNDKLTVLSGINLLEGGDGNDFLIGGMQSDRLIGGAGDDIILGDVGSLFGGSDVLEGGLGNDLLMGGRGADTFVFKPSSGADTIAGFEVNDILADLTFSKENLFSDFVSGVDKIYLDGFRIVDSSNVEKFFSDSADGARFSAEGTDILFYGVAASQIGTDDFVFSIV